MSELYFITQNPDKFEELKRALPQIERLSSPLEEVQDLDPRKIIEHKLEQVVRTCTNGFRFFVEDTSLYIAGMNGLPGPLIKWFEKCMSLDEIAKLAEAYGSNAMAKSIIRYHDGKRNYIFEGQVNGKIVMPRGDKDFGWGKIFVPQGYEQTFAEMGPIEKDKCGMRAKAIESFKYHLGEEKLEEQDEQ